MSAATPLEVDRRQARAGTPLDGRLVPQHDPLEPLRPAALGLPQRTGKHLHHGVGQGQRVVIPDRLELRHRHAVRHEEDGHVADDLARRRHLDDVAEGAIDVGVSARNLGPAVAQPHALCLLAEVRVLAARHLVQIHLRGARERRVVERPVVGANGLPVVRILVERVEVEAGGAVGMVQRRDERVEVGLAPGLTTLNPELSTANQSRVERVLPAGLCVSSGCSRTSPGPWEGGRYTQHEGVDTRPMRPVIEVTEVREDARTRRPALGRNKANRRTKSKSGG